MELEAGGTGSAQEAGARVPADMQTDQKVNLQVEVVTNGPRSPENPSRWRKMPCSWGCADCVFQHRIPLTERVNMVYMSTVVTNGHGSGLVVRHTYPAWIREITGTGGIASSC